MLDSSVNEKRKTVSSNEELLVVVVKCFVLLRCLLSHCLLRSRYDETPQIYRISSVRI